MSGGLLSTLAFLFPAAPAPAPAPAPQDLAPPVRLTVAGKPIDIGALEGLAHAGPEVADVDGDGRRDLVVGDFSGGFWFFRNIARDGAPVYAEPRRLEAGGRPAETPVY